MIIGSSAFTRSDRFTLLAVVTAHQWHMCGDGSLGMQFRKDALDVAREGKGM
jgi:hypothetical protein